MPDTGSAGRAAEGPRGIQRALDELRQRIADLEQELSALPTWHYDAGVPGGGLGEDGDFYLDTTTRFVYVKVAGVWT